MIIYNPFYSQQPLIATFNLKGGDLRKLQIIRDWIDTRSIIKSSEIPFKIQEIFEDLARSEMINFRLKQTYGYENEIRYVHYDNQIVILDKSENENSYKYEGYYFIPSFIIHTRIIIGLDNDNNYKKGFPLVPMEVELKKGTVVAYDYNRDLCYSNYSNKNYLIKINYLIYPKWTQFLISLNHFYKNQGYYKRKAISFIELYVGINNLFYCYFFVIISLICKSLVPFIYATSFVHYCRDFYEKNKLQRLFRRDYLFYGFLAKVELNYIYYYYFYDIQNRWFYINSIILMIAGYYNYDNTLMIIEMLLFHNFRNHLNLFIFFHTYCIIIVFLLEKFNN